ncbi:hypothetical protein BH10PSE12_BH10PSE12_06150 [soil metagenome]
MNFCKCIADYQAFLVQARVAKLQAIPIVDWLSYARRVTPCDTTENS